MVDDNHQNSGNNNENGCWGFLKHLLWVFRIFYKHALFFILLPMVSKTIHNYTSERNFIIVNISL